MWDQGVVGIERLGEKVRGGKKMLFKYVYEREQTNPLERMAGYLEVSSVLMYV